MREDLMRKIDDVLFERYFQPWSEDFEGKFGKDCFWLSKLFAFGFAGCFLPLIFTAFLTDVPVLGVVMLALLTVMVRGKISLANELKRKIKIGTMNPERACTVGLWTRIFWLLSGPALCIYLYTAKSAPYTELRLFQFLFLCVVLQLICTNYFLACTPMPPKPKVYMEREVNLQPV